MRHPIMHGNWSNNWLPPPKHNVSFVWIESGTHMVRDFRPKIMQVRYKLLCCVRANGSPKRSGKHQRNPRKKNRFDKTNSKVAGDGWHVKDIEWNVSTSFCLNIFLQIKKLFAKWVPPRVKCCPSAATWKKAWTSIAIATWSQYFVWRGSLWKKRGFRESRGYFDIDILCVFFVVNLLLRGSCICNCAGKWKST